jgi:tetratricopeptide (TPR) repeat protein
MRNELRQRRHHGRSAGIASVLAMSLAVALSPAAFAAGGGGGGGGGGGSGGGGGGSSINPDCPSGYVLDAKKHICVKAQSGLLPDQDLTDYAWALLEKKRYQDALDTLNLLAAPDTAVALNYRGYATRKLGRVDEGIGYYLQSVAADPAYPQVREYLGEAYVQKGRLDLASEQLTTIASLCGTSCEYYADLAEAIAAAK